MVVIEKRKKSYLDYVFYAMMTILGVFFALITGTLAINFYEYFFNRQFQNVTLYDNSGQIVGQWMGDFSVTRNGDTTKIKNSERVIEITGGIVIAEGN